MSNRVWLEYCQEIIDQVAARNGISPALLTQGASCNAAEAREIARIPLRRLRASQWPPFPKEQS